MAVRPLVYHPDARLSLVSAPVVSFDTALARVVDDLFETMYAAKGRGLAAVQIGVHARLFVLDMGWKDGAPTPQVFVNPVYVSMSAETAAFEEACLSIPGLPRRLTRPAQIRLSWQGADGAAHESAFSGAEAVGIQHEIDHLEGRLILDHPEAP
ncbi:MAG: peptide deformylase [Pseudomonadota bacterium]